jgi:hypothetical protein
MYHLRAGPIIAGAQKQGSRGENKNDLEKMGAGEEVLHRELSTDWQGVCFSIFMGKGSWCSKFLPFPQGPYSVHRSPGKLY